MGRRAARANPGRGSYARIGGEIDSEDWGPGANGRRRLDSVEVSPEGISIGPVRLGLIDGLGPADCDVDRMIPELVVPPAEIVGDEELYLLR
jgi:hypothetical protein